MSESPRETHEDRLFELALEEEFGAAMPPDVSGRVRWEIARQQKSRDQIGLLEAVAPTRRSLKFALIAAAGFLLGCFFAFSMVSSAVSSPTPVLVFAVDSGQLEWQGQYGTGQLLASQSRSLAVSVGDCWNAAGGSAPTVVRLVGFGSLIMDTDCRVEVKNVDWKAFGGGGVVGAVVVTVVAGALEFDSGVAIQAARKGDEVVLRDKGAISRGVDVSALQEQLALAQAEIGNLKTALDRTRIEAAPEAVPAVGDVPAEEAESELQTVRFGDREFAEVLAGIDFDKGGAAMLAMSSMTDGIVEKIDEEGGPMPIAELTALTKENTKVLEAMKTLFGSEMPGTGPNGQFTHPLVQSNLISSMLEKAGVGLDLGQQRAMEDLTARFAREDAQRLSGYGPESSMIEKLIGETELRERYFVAVEDSLRDDQSRYMHGDRSRGVVGLDLHSSGLVWQQVIQGGSFEVYDRAELGQEMNFRIRRILGAKGDLATQLKAVVASWAQEVPGLYWSQPASRRTKAGLGNTSYVANAASQQLRLYRIILSTMNLSTQQRERLLGSAKVFLPYRAKD